MRRGAARPTEWPASPRGGGRGGEAQGLRSGGKPGGGTARECEGESICRRASTPPEWTRCPGGENPRSGHQGRGNAGRELTGQGGDGNPLTTRATKESGSGGGNKYMARGPRTAPLPRPQRVTAADKDSEVPQSWQSYCADGTSPKNGIHSRREYGILAPEEPEGDPDNVGPWVRGAGRPRADVDRDGDGGRDRAASAPSTWHAGGRQQGAEPPLTGAHA